MDGGIDPRIRRAASDYKNMHVIFFLFHLEHLHLQVCHVAVLLCDCGS